MRREERSVKLEARGDGGGNKEKRKFEVTIGGPCFASNPMQPSSTLLAPANLTHFYGLANITLSPASISSQCMHLHHIKPHE